MWILQAFGSLKKGDVLCSRHFKKTDFDRSTLNTKLKAGAIPSIFECPYHLQEKREKLHCRKNFLLKTLPITHHGRQLVGASCIEEFEPQFIFEHSYSVMDSPKKLKHKLDRVIIELENTKESLRNVLAREKHFQKSLRKTIMELKDEVWSARKQPIVWVLSVGSAIMKAQQEAVVCEVISYMLHLQLTWQCFLEDSPTPPLKQVCTDSIMEAKSVLKMCRKLVWSCSCVTCDNYVFTDLNQCWVTTPRELNLTKVRNYIKLATLSSGN